MAVFWQDPRALAINRRQSHTPLKSYVAPDAAARQLALPTQGYAPAGSREQLLSGCNWHFKLFDSPEAVPAAFHDTSYEEEGFITVRADSFADSWMAVECSASAAVAELRLQQTWQLQRCSSSRWSLAQSQPLSRSLRAHRFITIGCSQAIAREGHGYSICPFDGPLHLPLFALQAQPLHLPAPSCCRSLCLATGSATATEHPSTPTTCTPYRLTRPLCQPATPPAATGTALMWRATTAVTGALVAIN